MHWLAQFVMASRSRAILVAAASSVLALAAPPVTSPFSYLGGAVIGLGTLRFGRKEGLLVLFGATVGAGLLGFLAIGQAQPLVVASLMLWAPGWVLASVLRRSSSLVLAMQVAALFGIVMLCSMYLYFGDPVPWWREVLKPVIQPLLEQGNIEVDHARVLDRAAEMMTGALASATVLGLTLTLFLARGWQALLDNPGGFSKEFQQVRLPSSMGLLLGGILIVAQLLDGMLAKAAAQSAMVLLVIYVLAGLALVHALTTKMKMKKGWIVAVYVSLMMLPLQAMTLLVIGGVSDSWIDYRSRLADR